MRPELELVNFPSTAEQLGVVKWADWVFFPESATSVHVGTKMQEFRLEVEMRESSISQNIVLFFFKIFYP